jgi:hypothetical protein
MQTYRNKSNGVLAEAIKLEGSNVDKVANWCQAQIVEERDMYHDTMFEALNVMTSDGKKRCSQGMYVVKVADDFYVTGGVAFERLYEVVPS